MWAVESNFSIGLRKTIFPQECIFWPFKVIQGDFGIQIESAYNMTSY